MRKRPRRHHATLCDSAISGLLISGLRITLETLTGKVSPWPPPGQCWTRWSPKDSPSRPQPTNSFRHITRKFGGLGQLPKRGANWRSAAAVAVASPLFVAIRTMTLPSCRACASASRPRSRAPSLSPWELRRSGSPPDGSPPDAGAGQAGLLTTAENTTASAAAAARSAGRCRKWILLTTSPPLFGVGGECCWSRCGCHGLRPTLAQLRKDTSCPMGRNRYPRRADLPQATCLTPRCARQVMVWRTGLKAWWLRQRRPRSTLPSVDR